MGKGGSTPRKKKPFNKDKKQVYAVTVKRDSVPSAAGEAKRPVNESNGKIQNSVLSGPPLPKETGTFNSFACDAVHSKLSPHYTMRVM